MIISNKDRRKLVSLLERYGYEKMTQFNVLNESFKSNILTTLEKINSRPHMGLSGVDGKRQEAALSPVGAAFMKAFPIPWHLITDDQIKIYYNGNLSKYIPKNGQLRHNKINTSVNRRDEEIKAAYDRIRTSAFVTGDLDKEQLKINRLKNKIGRILKGITDKNTKFANSIGAKDGNTLVADNVWVDATKKLARRYRENKDGAIKDFMILSTLYRFLNDVANSNGSGKTQDKDKEMNDLYNKYTNINELTGNYIGLDVKAAEETIDDAKKLYKKFVETRDGKVFRYGIVYSIRTTDTGTDIYENVEDMVKANVYEILYTLAEEDYIDGDDIKIFLENRYSGDYAIEDITAFTSQFILYCEQDKGIRGDLLNKINNKINNIYNNICRDKKKKNEDDYLLLRDLYAYGENYGENNATKASTFSEKIKTWYNDFKSPYKYSLVALTDKNFRLLYVFSCISFDKDFGYNIDTKAIYGWKIGDTPKDVEEELGGLEGKTGMEVTGSYKDSSLNTHNIIKITRRSGKKTIFNYNEIDPDMISNDDSIAFGIVIQDKGENTAMVEPTSIREYNKMISDYLRDTNLTPEEEGRLKHIKKTENSSGYYVKDNTIITTYLDTNRIKELIERNGFEYREYTDSFGKTKFTLKNVSSDTDLMKLANIASLLEQGKGNNYNLMKAIETFKDCYMKKRMFEKDFCKTPKEFGDFYDVTLNGNKDKSPYEESIAKPGKMDNVIETYNKKREKSLYQYYAAQRAKDTSELRLQFDSCMEHPHYPEILSEYEYAKKQIRDIFNALSPNVVINFDIKNDVGVLYTEQFRRLNREGIHRSFREIDNYSNNIDKMTEGIKNRKVFRNGTQIFMKIKNIENYPFKTSSEKCDFNDLKNAVLRCIFKLRAKLYNSDTTKSEESSIFEEINNIYTDYMNTLDEIDNSELFKNMGKKVDKKIVYTNEELENAAKFASDKIIEFYEKHIQYFG